MSSTSLDQIDMKTKENKLTYIDTSAESRCQGEVLNGTPAMKRTFSAWNILALGFNICNSWSGIAASAAIAIAAGGTVTLLYGILLVAFTMVCTALSLAELGSVYPTAGGQYHFTWFLSPVRLRRGLSYVCGAISIYAWLSLCAAINIVNSQIIMALVVHTYPSYQIKTWQSFLLYTAMNILFTAYNALALRKTLWMYNCGAILSISLCIIITIACPSRATSTADSHQIWTSFVNSSNGWPDAVSFLTGMSTPQFMVAGLDAVLHMAEECSEPRKVVPRALMATILVGSITAFAFAIAMAYSLPDMTAALATPTGFPIYAAWDQAMRSPLTATIFIIGFLTFSLIAFCAVVQTSSRLTWSFARDDALWQSRRLASVHPTLDVPLYALLLNSFAIFLIGIVYVCSTAAFNAFIASAAVTSQVSFAIPIVLLLIRGRGKESLPLDREWKVPAWLGYPANAVSVVWSGILLVFLCLPGSFPVTGGGMNYTSAVLAIMGLFAAANWFFYARKHYHGPQVDLAH